MEYCPGGRRSEGGSRASACWAPRSRRPGSPTKGFAKKYGFQVVDTAAGGYESLALSFDGTAPRFWMPPGGDDPGAGADHLLRHAVPSIHASLEQVKRFCGREGAPVTRSRWTACTGPRELPACSTTGRCSTGGGRDGQPAG